MLFYFQCISSPNKEERENDRVSVRLIRTWWVNLIENIPCYTISLSFKSTLFISTKNIITSQILHRTKLRSGNEYKTNSMITFSWMLRGGQIEYYYWNHKTPPVKTIWWFLSREDIFNGIIYALFLSMHHQY